METKGATALLTKGAEYYQCCRHLHMRGAGDCLKEAKALVDIQKEKGVTFDQFLAEITRVVGQAPNMGTDIYFQELKKHWES